MPTDEIPRLTSLEAAETPIAISNSRDPEPVSMLSQNAKPVSVPRVTASDEKSSDADVIAAPKSHPFPQTAVNEGLLSALKRFYILERNAYFDSRMSIDHAKLQAAVYLYLMKMRGEQPLPFGAEPEDIVQAFEKYKKRYNSGVYPCVPVAYVAKMMGKTQKQAKRLLREWACDSGIGIPPSMFFVKAPLIVIDKEYADERVKVDLDLQSGTMTEEQREALAVGVNKGSADTLLNLFLHHCNLGNWASGTKLPIGLREMKKQDWISGEDFVRFMIHSSAAWTYYAGLAMMVSVRVRMQLDKEMRDGTYEEVPLRLEPQVAAMGSRESKEPGAKK